MMIASLAYPYWVTLALAVVASGFLVRIFIIQHDCGHGSFLPSKQASEIIGSICGLLTLTPFHQWRHDHALHHASTGDLDRRGHGDVHTLTVTEYLQLSEWQRLRYRIFRHPLAMLLIGPISTFIVSHRFVLPDGGPRERRSVYATNAAILIIGVAMSVWLGVWAYLSIFLPVTLIAGMAAIWLFYCQHQFEDTYWAKHGDWNYETAALEGSSYFRLPRVLQWFTGNIGFHHVHHLSPRIPNYNLEACHNAHPRLQQVTTITIRSSLQAFTLKLWDEERAQLVGMKEIHAMERGASRS
jgi:omega-6 fatty acid desaturase (delta-12 desaturase)